MNRGELLKRISVNPQVCFGKPYIRRTRIRVPMILDNLAEGMAPEELMRLYPQLTLEDIRAAIAYAAETTRDLVIG